MRLFVQIHDLRQKITIFIALIGKIWYDIRELINSLKEAVDVR